MRKTVPPPFSPKDAAISAADPVGAPRQTRMPSQDPAASTPSAKATARTVLRGMRTAPSALPSSSHSRTVESADPEARSPADARQLTLRTQSWWPYSGTPT